jgi:hypothetical protein
MINMAFFTMEWHALTFSNDFTPHLAGLGRESP